MIVGSVGTEEETKEIQYIAKILLVGIRIQEISKDWRTKDENSNKKENK